jgi:hypothetical protein
MFVCCKRCVFSCRGLCDELITRPEESYRLWCVVVYDLETLWMRRPWPGLSRSATAKKNILLYLKKISVFLLKYYELPDGRISRPTGQVPVMNTPRDSANTTKHVSVGPPSVLVRKPPSAHFSCVFHTQEWFYLGCW